jgi:glycine/D-amino acid oxidase-like deaminating enzyme
MTQIDYLIVGQGIAGSMLSWELLRRGKNILVIDNHHHHSSTMTAGGIVTPITGKRFVKSWRIDELLAAMDELYGSIEKECQSTLWQRRPNIRIFHTQEQVNEWNKRAADWNTYMGTTLDLTSLRSVFYSVDGAAETLGGGRVNMRLLTEIFAAILRGRYLLRSIIFDFNNLTVNSDSIDYHNGEERISSKRIVFCEGWQSINNPYFNYLPFRPSKGESLIVRFLGEYPFGEYIIKSDVLIVHLHTDCYWVGATNVFESNSPEQTDEGLSELINRLISVVKIPFEVIEHRACIRPTVQDRLPLVGQHPNFSPLYLLNGLGTKGASLAPFLVQNLVNYMEEGLPLDSEFSIHRFNNK